jgi:hypothetical protein
MPTSEVACVRRERSNTPLQALTLLNDPAFVEAAEALARRIVKEGPATPEGRATFGFRLCLGRVPTESELAAIVGFQAKLAADSPESEQSSWASVARALLNLDETITRE